MALTLAAGPLPGKSVAGSTFAEEVPVASTLLLIDQIYFLARHYFVLQISKAVKSDKIVIGQNNKSRRSLKGFSSAILKAIRASVSKIVNL